MNIMLCTQVLKASLTYPDTVKLMLRFHLLLTLKAPNTKIHVEEFANSADPDEMAHSEPSHLDLQCLLFSSPEPKAQR